MSSAPPSFWTPPQAFNQNGRLRRVGVELEFAGLAIEEVAAVVIECFGGVFAQSGPVVGVVLDSALAEFGDIRIELDAAVLKDGRLEHYLTKVGVENPETLDSVEAFVARSAGRIVPMEVVAPPLPLDRLPDLERLRAALARTAAQDTHASVFNAFGLHFNPEAPSFEPGEILDILRAFIILYEWLRNKHEVSVSRRIAPFIDAFPRSYAHLIFQPDYRPDLDSLVRDCLEHNPTRNRPLDVLPLLFYLRPDAVSAVEMPPLVSPRPAYHYRLPNCALNDPAWTLAEEWNRWVVVERVAHDKARLAELSDSFRLWLERPDKVLLKRIAAAIREWIR